MTLDVENPRTLLGKPGNTTGASLSLDKLRIAANGCHCNTGGDMTLTQLGIAFWHDLAAPAIAGIIAGMVVNWLRSRK